MIIPFGPWAPDSAGVDATDAAGLGRLLAVAKNVFSLPNGYGPIPALAPFGTNTLPSTCVGMAVARNSNGGWVVFAGTATSLYKLIAGSWTDVSRSSGGNYNVSTSDYWSFAQFGTKLIATHANDDPQVIDVDLGANFSALGGSPPRARYVAVVGDFAVLAGLAGNQRKVRNSGINDATSWALGVSLCDEQEFPDGGRITGIAGGEFGYVVQEKSVRQMIFQPGQDVAFRFERVEQERGCAAGYSLAAVASEIYFLSDDGFYNFGPNGLNPIGAHFINDWFRNNSDSARFFSTIAFADPFGPRVAWAFCNSSGSTSFDRLLIFDRKLARWSYAEVTAQFWASFATPGATLEQLDSYGNIDGGGIPYPFDSRIWEGGRPGIGAIDTTGGLSFLSGTSALTALLRTCPLHLVPGRRSKVTDVYPLGVFNDATLKLRLGRQEHTGAATSWTNQTTPSTRTGIARLTAAARVHQVELEISQSAGTPWTQAQGADVTARAEGTR